MKIGILTFHNAVNYGAVLQAYATQALFTSIGNDVEIIDYRNDVIRKTYINRPYGKSIKELIAFTIRFYSVYKREEQFNSFLKSHLNISHKRYHINNLKISGYDIILIGSDQVWNPIHTGGLDPFYLGNFSKADDTKIIAWAVSSNSISFNDNEAITIQKNLKNFTAISVREEEFGTYISGLTNKKIAHTIDPTLLLNRSQWLKLYKPIHKKRYVLIYAINNTEEVLILGKQLAKAKGLAFIVIPVLPKAKANKHYRQCLGPSGFVSYINDADYIVTSSFHGTAFSLIFQKQFFCYVKEGTSNMRIESILNQVGLSDRIVSDNTTFNNINAIDYSVVNPKLDALRAESMKFVDEILK